MNIDSKPLISVCIPTYNRPKEVCEAINSVLEQLDDDLKDIVEVVVSHDPGSPNADEVENAVQFLAKQWGNVYYHKNETNLRFGNALKLNTLANGEYLVLLSDDDCLTNFSLRYLVDIIKQTSFDFLLHKPVFTPDITISVPKTPNTYTVYYGVKEYINGLYERERSYKTLISYFSFNSVMVVKSSYRQYAYSQIDKKLMFSNEFPQEFPPYYNLKDKIIVLADSVLVKARILNASYYGSLKLIKDLKITMDFIEKQNDLAGLSSWEAIKKTCVRGWSRTMYLGIMLSRLHLDYKKKGLVRWLYFFYKKFVQ